MFRLPTEIPIEEYPPPTVFVQEAERLVEAAKEKKIVLRVMGGMAIFMRCPQDFREVWTKLKRLGDRVFTDIDFVSYSRFKNSMIDFMSTVGYKTDANLIVQAGKNRHIFYGGKVPMVEVFYDRLEMCHTIDYDKRLEADTMTVPLSELILQKLQIVKINDKDIKDLIVLLATHDVGTGDPDKIDAENAAYRYMQNDWGFHYTATTNLAKVKAALPDVEVLDEGARQLVADRIGKVLEAFDGVPKSAKWKLRARVGQKVKWYNDVDEW